MRLKGGKVLLDLTKDDMSETSSVSIDLSDEEKKISLEKGIVYQFKYYGTRITKDFNPVMIGSGDGVVSLLSEIISENGNEKWTISLDLVDNAFYIGEI